MNNIRNILEIIIIYNNYRIISSRKGTLFGYYFYIKFFKLPINILLIISQSYLPYIKTKN